MRPGRVADHSPLLMPWSWKSRAIPLPNLWSHPACKGITFNYMLQAHPSGRAVKDDLSVVEIGGLNPAGKWLSELITRSEESY